MDLLGQLTAALGDRHRIERELGQGGMAVVALAEDVKHHRQVAIKVLKPELSAALGGDRFLREIEIAAALQHPHILPLYDSGQAAGLLYYVMPFAGVSRSGGGWRASVSCRSTTRSASPVRPAVPCSTPTSGA